MSVAASIRQMIERGLTIEQALIAAEVMEANLPSAIDEQAERRRKKDRERKRLRNSAESAEAAEVVENPLPLSPSPQTPQPHTPAPERDTTRTRGTRRCPESWLPSHGDIDLAKAEGFNPGEIERELAKFRDYTFGTARSDWSATFRNWMRKSGEQHRKSSGRSAPSHGGKSRAQSNLDSAARALARRVGQDPAGGWFDEDGGSTGAEILHLGVRTIP